MILPRSQRDLTKLVIEVKEICRVSAGYRAALAKQQSLWIQTGKATGQPAIINTLYAHNDKVASHLFSPAEMRFMLDFEAHYPPEILARGEMVGRLITREWERKDLDIGFGSGVGISLDYGSCIFKQLWGHGGLDYRLIMPWLFGVYKEDINSIDDQEAVCETGLITMPEVWRRISHLKDAEKLYTRIKGHAGKGEGNDTNNSFFHNVISTAVLNTSLESVRQQPGGIVQLSNDPSMAMLGPQIEAELVMYHELYIKDDDTEDYTTCLLIEPDILVSPVFKRENQFAPKVQPFSLIQANRVPGYFWGRSEITDLMQPQDMLATTLDDIKRVLGVQFDKLLAFSGTEGITDEKYDQFRQNGYIDMGPGGDVKDMTPEMPPAAFQTIEIIKQLMQEVSGFGNILSGQNEAGVRAGNHADTMVKMASPRLRDRSLMIERQCAAAADKTLDLLEAKDARTYSADPTTSPNNDFLLADLPSDRRVTIDSHSSSPIFSDEHTQLVFAGLKAGFVGGDSAIEMLPLPQKDILKQRYAKMQAQKAALIQEHPEILTHQKPGPKGK